MACLCWSIISDLPARFLETRTDSRVLSRWIRPQSGRINLILPTLLAIEAPYLQCVVCACADIQRWPGLWWYWTAWSIFLCALSHISTNPCSHFALLVAWLLFFIFHLFRLRSLNAQPEGFLPFAAPLSMEFSLMDLSTFYPSFSSLNRLLCA